MVNSAVLDTTHLSNEQAVINHKLAAVRADCKEYFEETNILVGMVDTLIIQNNVLERQHRGLERQHRGEAIPIEGGQPQKSGKYTWHILDTV